MLMVIRVWPGFCSLLQKCQIPFATGILHENDIDCPVASALSGHVVTAPAFEEMTEEQLKQALEWMQKAGTLIHAGTPIGSTNRMNGRLLELAEEMCFPVYRSVGEWLDGRPQIAEKVQCVCQENKKCK